MKVADLNVGMLLELNSDKMFFAKNLDRETTYYIAARDEKTWTAGRRDDSMPRTMIYLGTRKELNINPDCWCKQYVLFDSEMVGIAPHSWKHLQPVTECNTWKGDRVV